MCSVIEIKNANEYYIHYHSPESIPPNALLDGKTKMEEKTAGSETINDINNSENEEGQTKLKVAKKDQEVTSDRGSSASPSLEDEDEQQQNAEKEAEQEKLKNSSKSSSPSKESKIPVRSKKLQAPQPPPQTTIPSPVQTTPTAGPQCIPSTAVTPKSNDKKSSMKKSNAPKPPATSSLDPKKVLSNNPFLNEAETTPENSPNNSNTNVSNNKRNKKASGLPRPSPPKNSLSSKSKLTSARSLENVPITVNSHIPALGGPLRPSSVASKKVTSEMGTQCMEQAEKNQVTKSVSVENLTSPTRKSRSSDCLLLQSQSKKAHSESSDPICGSQVKKWSYTNGAITTDLRQYLNTRFPKGGVDHELQNTIRDNLYLRTVPVTTREPRQEEKQGVDYTFLSKEEFIALEKRGELLESGVFDGNHYGTPKPNKDFVRSDRDGSSNSNNSSSGGPGGDNGKQWGNQIGNSNVNFPGAHPSSEGKRRRNRSNVEAMTAKHSQQDNESAGETISNNKEDLNHNGTAPETPSGSTSTTKSGGSSGMQAADSGHPDSPDVPEVVDTVVGLVGPPPIDTHLGGPPHEGGPPNGLDPLGPLPPNWEKAYTDKGESYFIDHNSGTSHWLDPRLSRVQKKRPEECSDDELPFGWERIDDPHYGTYFIDHVNRRTQYENPVLVAKAANQSADAIMTSGPLDGQFPMMDGPGGLGPPPPPGPQSGTFPRGSKKNQSPFFTRDPNHLRGERIRTQLVKSLQGLGFTIVGGDDNVEEFLQIKSVVPNGPAWLDGNLKTGDVLVYVNDTCVLGFTHLDMVTMFQAISSGEAVNLEVCRGYPLPFDPDDPNTEIVTTVAVTSPGQNEWAADLERQRNQSDVQSMPDLSGSGLSGKQSTNNLEMFRPSSADLLGNHLSKEPENIMTVPITKGGMGFGFTIADSAFGQKVKKILDRPRCKTLQEGDVLIEINGKSVRGMSHSEVVQVLKECTRGSEANISIQRGLLPPGSGSTTSPTKSKFKKGDSGSGLLKSKSGFLFRSKTPTAELYSTQEREQVPNRPKTPLVNMSVRSKTPVTVQQPEQNTRQPPQTQNQPFQRNDLTRASLGGHFSDSNSAYNNPYNALSDQMAATGLYSAGGPASAAAGQPQNQVQTDYNRSRSPGRELDDPSAGNYYPGGQQMVQQPQQSQQTQNYNDYGQYGDAYGDYQHQPYYNGYPDPVGGETGYGYTTNRVNPGGNVVTNGGGPEPGYSPPQNINHAGGGSFRSGSLPRSIRKESTSFEHSEPLPGNLTRWPRADPRLRNGEAYVELTVTLQRHDSGFGFRIVGGTEEGSQVSIGHIVPGGAADLDGRLFSGDEIIAVDNVSVVNSSHHQVVGLMGQAAQNGRVTLTVQRRIYQPQDYGSVPRPTEYPYDITVTRRENEGFGFVIISSASRAGSTIGRIIAGSPAERCGRLHIGDRILAVNRVDISSLHHGDIVNLIKDSGYSVVLTVGPPIDEVSSNTSNSHREDHELNMLEMDDQYYAVELGRGARGFGFSIRGGREFSSMPLFVLRIAIDGPAAADGRLRVGDQIVEINGVNTKNMTHAEAIELIKSGGNAVRLLVKRGKVPPAAVMSDMGLSPLSPTPLPSGSAVPVSSGSQRPISAMSQPMTASGYMLPQGAMPLPGLTTTSNGMLPSQSQGGSYNAANNVNNNYGSANSALIQHQQNGHLNGPVSHSSPRMADPYYWNQY